MSDIGAEIPLYTSGERRASTRVAALVSAAALALLPLACGPAPARLTVLEGATMGSGYRVQIVSLPARIASAALREEIEAALRELDLALSTYRDDSELARFNAAASTAWTAVSPALLTVVEEARRVSELTDGAFDVTVGPIVNLWGFGPQPGPDAVPDGAAIEAARERVGYRMLETRADPPALRKGRPDIYVDLSAIAVGYAVDRLAALLDAHDLTDYVVEIGGEIRTRGRNERGEAWAIAVEEPLADARRVERLLRVPDAGVSTSGDYRDYFEAGGKHYSHVLDPKSGRPVTHDLASVTIIADTAMRADALSTGLMVLGPDAGYTLAVRESFAALFVRRAGDRFEEHATPALAAYVD
jgi:thiamine biosynthesis lipoprotein